jgi:hypothetical protein
MLLRSLSLGEWCRLELLPSKKPSLSSSSRSFHSCPKVTFGMVCWTILIENNK